MPIGYRPSLIRLILYANWIVSLIEMGSSLGKENSVSENNPFSFRITSLSSITKSKLRHAVYWTDSFFFLFAMRNFQVSKLCSYFPVSFAFLWISLLLSVLFYGGRMQGEKTVFNNTVATPSDIFLSYNVRRSILYTTIRHLSDTFKNMFPKRHLFPMERPLDLVKYNSYI